MTPHVILRHTRCVFYRKHDHTGTPQFIGNRPLRLLALVVIIAGSTFVGVPEARSEPKPFGKFEDCISYRAGDYPQFGGTSTDYSAKSIHFTNGHDGTTIASNLQFCLVYIVYYSDGSSATVGGLNGSGTSATGWINAESTYFSGYDNGQMVDYPFCENMSVSGFVDVNGNGSYGSYDSSTGCFGPEESEYINDLVVANSQPFQTAAGTLSAGDISGWYNLSIGLPVMGFQLFSAGPTNIITFSVATDTTDRWHLSIQYRDSLTNGTWHFMNQYFIPAFGAVVSVTDTNTVPQRFYRVVSP